MKTKNIFKVPLFCLAAVLALQVLVCCASSQPPKDDDLFFFTDYSQAIPAFEGNPSPDNDMNIFLTLIDARQARLAKFIRSILYDGHTTKQHAENVYAEFSKEFRDYAADAGAWIMPWVFEEIHRVTVAGNYAVISQGVYSYYGGAHGTSATIYHVINIKTPENLTLDDIIVKEYFAPLKPIVDRELRLFSESLLNEPLPPGVPLTSGVYFENDFEYSYFYPSGDGIHFWWNVYELAPYVVGPIDVTVSWNELEGFLTTKGAELAKAFRK
jgi:hypothetical protein